MLLPLLLVFLVLLGVWLLTQSSSPPSPKLLSTEVQRWAVNGTGVTSRGPIRLTISDQSLQNIYDEFTPQLQANLVRKSPKDVAFTYRQDIKLEINGKEVVVAGYKSHTLVASNSTEYGHFLAKDGSFMLYFETSTPRLISSYRHHQTQSEYSILALTGERGKATISYSVKAFPRQKEVTLSGELFLQK